MSDMLRRFERGDFDMVAIGRALLQDPEWVQKVKLQRFDELKAFDTASLQQLY